MEALAGVAAGLLAVTLPAGVYVYTVRTGRTVLAAVLGVVLFAILLWALLWVDAHVFTPGA